MLQQKEFETFRVTTKRSNKEFRLTSQQVSVDVGSFVVEKMETYFFIPFHSVLPNCFIGIVKFLDKRFADFFGKEMFILAKENGEKND